MTSSVSDLPDWRTDAICAQTDPEVWFPEKGERSTAAKAMCSKCPVMSECLQWALDSDERYGVWGGTTARERRHLTRHHASS